MFEQIIKNIDKTEYTVPIVIKKQQQIHIQPKKI